MSTGSPDLQVLNQQILPKLTEMQEVITKFHSTQISQFQQIIKDIQQVQDQLRQKQQQCQNYIHQIKNKRKDHQKLGQISKGVLQAKSQQIKSKTKNIDAVSAGIKQSVGKIKPQKLSKLPVQNDRNLKKLFTVIYQTIYNEDNSEFDWKKFKKMAIKHEDGEDFISRLVNINYKDLTNQKYDRLMQLKNDPEYEHMAINETYSIDIIDLADWVEYVCLGHQFTLQKKRAQKDYDKIRKDVDKKSKGSLQISQNFWKQASNQTQNYQIQIQSFNSQLKSIVFLMKKCDDNCHQLSKKINQKIQSVVKVK